LNAAKEKLKIVSGAAPPPFRIFARGLPRRLRRRNAFGLIQEYCTKKRYIALFYTSNCNLFYTNSLLIVDKIDKI